MSRDQFESTGWPAVGGPGVRLDIEQRIGHLTLDRPERLNAINLSMVESLARVANHVRQLAETDELRVLIIRGASTDQDRPSFTVGADLRDRSQMTVDQMWEFSKLLREFTWTLHAGPVPVIAAIHGYCLGAGLEIAVSADFRVAVAGSVLGFPEVKLGAFPGVGGAVLTPRLVGVAAARDLLYSGRQVEASAAMELGLVDCIVDDRSLLYERVAAHAEELSEAAPLALRALKTLMNEAGGSVREAFAMSDRLRRPLNYTADHREGVTAFIERRPATFRGT